MCDEQCKLLANYISSMSDPLYLEIPRTFEEYWKILKSPVKSGYKRALANNYKVKQLYEITEDIYKDLREIWTSKEIRQQRPAGKYYGVIGNGPHPVLESWWIKDYSIYTCPKHKIIFYGCFLGSKMVGYAELLICNEIIIMHSTLGHGAHLPMGIMKFLYVTIIKENMNNMRYFSYGNYDPIGSKRFLMDDLGINKHNNAKFIYQISKGEL